jgi:predicted outer membrane repeat protein
MTRVRYRLKLEALEDRRLLATCHVVRLGDFGAGGDLGGGHSRGDLRYCINKANADAGSDTILLERAGTINLTGPLPTLSGDVLIAGIGSDQVTVRRDTIDAYRILTVDENVSVDLFGLTLANGFADGSGFAGRGGAILNFGTLTLVGDVVILGNLAQSGGGIYTVGDFSAHFSTIAGNVAQSTIDGGGGIFVLSGTTSLHNSSISTNTALQGGGIYNAAAAVLSLEGVKIDENQATFQGVGLTPKGGGIHNSGLLSISNSTISSNTAVSDSGLFCGCNVRAYGGGISSTGIMTIESSTLMDNFAYAKGTGDLTWAVSRGGGIMNTDSGDARIINSTITSNTAGAHSDGYGGGISNDLQGSLLIEHSTIAFNDAWGDGGWGGGLSNTTPFTQIHHTIIARNNAIWGLDVIGEIGSQGYNLIERTSGGSGYAPTDVLDVKPMLASLGENGGPTPTHSLLPGSPAIDAGDPNPADPPEWDQRGPGFPRIVNGRIDIGAFEVQATGAPPSFNFAVLTTADFHEHTASRERQRPERTTM